MIRDAVLDDADAIGAIHVQSWRETYPGIMPRPLLDELDPVARAAGWRHRLTAHANGERHDALIVVVAREELDGEAVGFGSASADPDTGVGEIHTLYLLRRAQGKGIGAAMLRGLAARLAKRGAMAVELWMAAGNPTAGFYEHLGGVVTGERVERVGDAELAEVRYRWNDISQLAPNHS